jgi:hypothetical protein
VFGENLVLKETHFKRQGFSGEYADYTYYDLPLLSDAHTILGHYKI